MAEMNQDRRIMKFGRDPVGAVIIPMEVTILACKEEDTGEVLSDGDTYYEYYGTFEGCVQIKKVSFEGPAYLIGRQAFKDCTGLVDIVFPASVEKIEQKAFEGCNSLVNIVLPASLKTIDQDAFRRCKNLLKVTIEGPVKEIGSEVFRDCTRLVNIVLPVSVVKIGTWAFGHCSSLVDVVLPGALKSIGSGAFADCTSLQHMTLPPSVIEVGAIAFYGCTSLKEMVVLGKPKFKTNPHGLQPYPEHTTITHMDKEPAAASAAAGAAATGQVGGGAVAQSFAAVKGFFSADAKQKVFEDTCYIKAYSECSENYGFFSGVTAMNNFIEAVGEDQGVDNTEVQTYKESLENKIEDFKSQKIEVLAGVTWTTALRINDVELCSHINRAIINERPDMIKKVAPVCRIMNKLVVNRLNMFDIPWPEDFRTYRGTGMPREHFGFFTEGKVYRASMFLASSSKREVAENFMTMNSVGGKSAVMFTIQFHKVLKCIHVNYLDAISSCKGECEYLMPPYSGFRVMSANFDPTDVSEVVIYAFPDNQAEELKRVPIAPWH